jgi:hypothetical protein
MRTRRGWWLAGLALVGLVSCGLGHEKPPGDAARSEYSAEDDSILDLLEPEEREAVERAGVTGARPQQAAPAQDGESAADTAGKVGLSVLSVAITIGAAVAPFLLF